MSRGGSAEGDEEQKKTQKTTQGSQDKTEIKQQRKTLEAGQTKKVPCARSGVQVFWCLGVHVFETFLEGQKGDQGGPKFKMG